MYNVAPEEWQNMSDAERNGHMLSMEEPYIAANGHLMQRYPRYAGERPIYSSAWTECLPDCMACANGEKLEDW